MSFSLIFMESGRLDETKTGMPNGAEGDNPPSAEKKKGVTA